jgi:hypothetical protein
VKLPGARDGAYLCFLGVAAAVPLFVATDALEAAGLLPPKAGEMLVLFLLLPLNVAGLLAGVLGMVLTLRARTDPRLYMLSVVTITLFVFWVRHGTLGVSPRLSLLHTVGVLLFSLHWLAEKRQARRQVRRRGA